MFRQQYSFRPSRAPVARSAFLVRHGNNDQIILLVGVDQQEGKYSNWCLSENGPRRAANPGMVPICNGCLLQIVKKLLTETR